MSHVTCSFRSVASEMHPERNEDAVLMDEKNSVYGVFDGLGGHAAGEIASRLAADTIEVQIEKGETLEGAFAAANAKILQEAMRNLKYSGMATTAVVAKISGSNAVVAWLGDSRAYRFRESRLQSLTVDDRLNSRHIINEALGLRATVTPRITETELQPRDIILLVSDGVTDNLTDKEIESLVSAQSLGPNSSAQSLVQAALKRSREEHLRAKPDDMSAVVVEIK